MQNMAKILSFVLLITAANSYAQSGKIIGTINSNGNPVSYGTVILNPISKSTHTDTSGKFVFENLMDGTYTLSFSKMGYITHKKNVKILNHNTIDLNIHLLQNSINIKAITIHAHKWVQGYIFGKFDLNLRPASSSQDLLRLVPGLCIAQHAGGGKAEQLFMRGFDIDHGTDFAIYVDGMPVNMPSHAHGQGYADLHFLIPETVSALEVNKGPHTTKYGDLATAGSGEFKTMNTLENNFVKLEAGLFDAKRALGIFDLLGHTKHLFSKKNEALYTAIEYQFTNSYFEQKQNLNRFNIFTKYSGQLNNGDKLILSLSTFRSRWDASGQIPNRKVKDGSITPLGSIDPSEGGQTGRSNFNIIHEKNWHKWTIKNQMYLCRYDFNLYSNFTFYLSDTLNGDQIFQADHRNIAGYTNTFKTIRKVKGKELVSIIGAGIRYDNSIIQLEHTVKRQYLNTMVSGKLNQINAWLYADENYQLSKKLHLNLGVRTDIYNFNFKNYTFDTASGIAFKTIVNPKINLKYNVNTRLQGFAKSGFGFHSNDARAAITGSLQNTLARAFGNEIGVTFKPTDKIILNLAFWTLALQSELIYVGDEGIVDVAGRTRRLGMDLSIRYELTKHLFLDADLNINRGKLKDEPAHANRIPLAPTLTSSGGMSYKKPNGLSGSLRYRYMGDRAAIEDNSIIADGYFLIDALIKYQYKNYQVGFSAENILNSNWKEAQFVNESRLRDEIVSVNEIHFTTGTPFFAKINIGYTF